ncbi:EamA family transporter [Streptomyces tirandamycinicus]|uniref:EamA family transporter n=1 Tax=Streptomyces tirandamycinicus TaxID=2174846 RepID=UPI002446A89C|nr:EamA family transporter [Streptomyces tirandamycinicus]
MRGGPARRHGGAHPAVTGPLTAAGSRLLACRVPARRSHGSGHRHGDPRSHGGGHGRARTYAYVNPVVAVLLGSLVLGERLTWPIAVGGAVVVAGVCLIVSTERRR